MNAVVLLTVALMGPLPEITPGREERERPRPSEWGVPAPIGSTRPEEGEWILPGFPTCLVYLLVDEEDERWALTGEFRPVPRAGIKWVGYLGHGFALTRAIEVRGGRIALPVAINWYVTESVVLRVGIDLLRLQGEADFLIHL